MAKYLENLGASAPDNLFAGTDVKILCGTGTIKSGEGALKRGTVLGQGSDGKLAVLGGSGLTAYGVLCNDVDATSGDVVAEVYLTGRFNKNALIAKAEYTITAADLKALRDGGIFVENSVE